MKMRHPEFDLVILYVVGEQLCSMEIQWVDLHVFSFVPKWEENFIS